MKKQLHPGNLYPDTPDGTLIQCSLAGDHEAFEHLVERYRALLVGYISRWCADDSLVLDILQQVLLQLYVSLPTLRTDRSLKAWIIQVAHHRCIDESRRERPILFSRLERASSEEDLPPFATLPDPDPLPEELAEQHEVQQHIQQAIQSLPVKRRVIVWMRYADQLSFAEIGRRLNIPQATAKTHFARAKPLLRQLLAKDMYSNPVLR